MKILITGGLGFLGFFLTKYLCRNKENTIVLADNFFRGKEDNEVKKLLKNQPNIRLITVDLTRPNGVQRLGDGYDRVYHFAAVNGTRNFYEIPHITLRTNILSSVNILDWFANDNQKNGKIILSSSSETYAGSVRILPNFPFPTPETVPLSIEDVYNPRWSYAGSKIISELLFINYARIYKFRMSIVRYHNVYGPRMGHDHVIPEFFLRVRDRKSQFPIFGGKETRAFCYVDDAVRGTYMVMESCKTDSEVINIGNDREEISMINLAKKVFTLSDFYPKLDIRKAPAGSVLRRCPDLTKIKQLTKYQPRISLDNGLKKTWSWHCQDTDPLHAQRKS